MTTIEEKEGKEKKEKKEGRRKKEKKRIKREKGKEKLMINLRRGKGGEKPKLIQQKAYLIVNGVEFGQHDPVYRPRVRDAAEVDQRAAELHQLVDAIIPDKRFPDEKNKIRLNGVYELCNCTHEWLVVLHSSGGVNEDNIMTLALCWINFFALFYFIF